MILYSSFWLARRQAGLFFPNEPASYSHMIVSSNCPATSGAYQYEQLGVEPSHYRTMESALVATIQRYMGPRFTPEVAEAWHAAFAVIAAAMLSADEREV
jgi:hypothetical protein